MVSPVGKDEAGLSLRFEGEENRTVLLTLLLWTPPTWVTRYCLVYAPELQSCSLALLTEERSLSPASAVRSASELIARALKSLLTHCSQHGLSPTEIAVETDGEGQRAVERVLAQFHTH